jgi:protein-S-isoprenylcysteine O-methyltransferase Ste14
VVGLSLVFIGLGGLFWCLVLHFAQAPQTVEITYIFPSVRSSWREMMSKLGVQGTNQVMLDAETEPATTYLMMEGPYKFSRHPMYLSVIILWFGWALFYGNIIVFVVWLITWLGITLFVAPPEEQALEARFGEAYREYKSRVPRWFGMPRG